MAGLKLVKAMSALHIVTIITSILGMIINIALMLYIQCRKSRKLTPKYEHLLKSFSVVMLLTGCFLLYYIIGQDIIGHSDTFIHNYFIIGMCLSDVVSVMHWVVLTVEVHYHAKFINPFNSIVRNIKSLILIAWIFSGTFAGGCIYIMKIHSLVGIVSFFTVFVALLLFLFYATLLRRNLRRRNKIYFVKEKNEAPIINYKFDYIPTQYIVNYFVFVSPWVGGGMYEAITDTDLTEKTSAVLLFFYSIVMIVHPAIYLLRKFVSLH